MGTLNLAFDLTNTEDTQFMPYFFQFIYSEQPALTEKMFDDEIIAKYDTFMHFIEGEYDEFVLPMLPATVNTIVQDKDMNDRLIEEYEESRELIESNLRGRVEPDAKYIA